MNSNLPSSAQAADSLGISNSQAMDIVTSKALTMIQNIYAKTIFPPSNPTINDCIPRNVGIIKKFVIEIVGTITNTDGALDLTLTDGGLANLISQVVFYDLNNNVRVQTTGLHLMLLAAMKRRRMYGGTADWNQTFTTGGAHNVSQPFNVAPASWPVLVAPTTIAHGTSGTVRAVFEVPLAYSDKDLRGAIYANVINTSMSLQLTLNQNAVVAAGADTTFAVYSGAAGNFTSATVNIYQVYLDQLPADPKTGRLILPTTALSTVYELKNTNLQAITPNQDFPIPFTNFRSFFSAFLIYFNGTNRLFGTDINYFSHQTANFTNIFKYDALYNTHLSREVLGADLPAGYYYFSYRQQPVWTTQNGNQQININASTAGAGAYAQVMWEDMALQNTLSGGASLPA